MQKTNSAIIPTMQYRDANKAVDWLCEVFGFVQKAVYRDEKGQVMHAELQLGTALIMIGPRTKSPFGRLIKSPLEIGNFNTHALYIIVDEIEAHYKRAIEMGAMIELELVEQEYGGKDYTCRDFEGFLWSFGTYNPWGIQEVIED